MAQNCVFQRKERAALLLFLCTMFSSIDRAWSSIRPRALATPIYPSQDRFFDVDGSSIGSMYPQDEELYNFNEQIPSGLGSRYRNGPVELWETGREQNGAGGLWGAPGGHNEGLWGSSGRKRGRNGDNKPWGQDSSFGSISSLRGRRGGLAGPEEISPFQLDNSAVSINDFSQDRGRRGIGVYPGDSSYDPESFALRDPWDAPTISHRNAYPPVDYYQDGIGESSFFDDAFGQPRGRRSFGPTNPYDNYKHGSYDIQPDPYAPFYNSRSYQQPPMDFQGPPYNNPYSQAQQLPEFSDFPGSGRKTNRFSQPVHSVSYGPYGYMDSDFDESFLKALERPAPEEQQQPGNADFYRLDGSSRPDNLYGEMNNPDISGAPFRGNAQARGKGKNGGGSNFDSAAALEEEVVMGDLRRGEERRRGPGRASPGYPPTNPRIQTRAPGPNLDETPNLPNEYPEPSQQRPRPNNLQGVRYQRPNIRPHQAPRARHGGGRTHGPYPPPPPRNKNPQPPKGSPSMPRTVSARREYFGDINDGYGRQSMDGSPGGPYGRQSRGDGMYGRMNGIRQRRSPLAGSFYDDDLDEALPQRYGYQTPPLYAYEYPSLVYDPSSGSPEVILNRRQETPNRRLVRRLVKRPPLLRRENRLRKMRQQIPDVDESENIDTENEPEEIATELEPATSQPSTILDDDSTTTLTTDDDTTPETDSTPTPTEIEDTETDVPELTDTDKNEE